MSYNVRCNLCKAIFSNDLCEIETKKNVWLCIPCFRHEGKTIEKKAKKVETPLNPIDEVDDPPVLIRADSQKKVGSLAGSGIQRPHPSSK